MDNVRLSVSERCLSQFPSLYKYFPSSHLQIMLIYCLCCLITEHERLVVVLIGLCVQRWCRWYPGRVRLEGCLDTRGSLSLPGWSRVLRDRITCKHELSHFLQLKRSLIHYTTQNTCPLSPTSETSSTYQQSYGFSLLTIELSNSWMNYFEFRQILN